MLSTREVYNQIQNPLDDIDIIKMLIYGYIDNYPAYFLATNCLYKENENEDIKQKNEFYSLIFNTWKNNIINMNNERISYLLKQGKIEKDFLILKKYLLNIPNMSSVSEIDIFWENIEKDVKVNIKMHKKLKIKMYKIFNQFCIGSVTSESIFNLSFNR